MEATNPIKSIKSNKILMDIFTILNDKKTLYLVKYNKIIQKK